MSTAKKAEATRKSVYKCRIIVVKNSGLCCIINAEMPENE
jgi:hypothetical protein